MTISRFLSHTAAVALDVFEPQGMPSNSALPIVTPVPLLYSARSKAVLDSMISPSPGSSGASPRSLFYLKKSNHSKLDLTVCAMNGQEFHVERQYPDLKESL